MAELVCIGVDWCGQQKELLYPVLHCWLCLPFPTDTLALEESSVAEAGAEWAEDN